MKPWVTLAEAGRLILQRRDTELVIRVDNQVLMTSRAHASERALAAVALEHPRLESVLIGGLGMGFTLRALLDGLPPKTKVRVAELSPATRETLRGFLAGNPSAHDSLLALSWCVVIAGLSATWAVRLYQRKVTG